MDKHGRFVRAEDKHHARLMRGDAVCLADVSEVAAMIERWASDAPDEMAPKEALRAVALALKLRVEGEGELVRILQIAGAS